MRKFALLAALAAIVGPAQAQDQWAGATVVPVRHLVSLRLKTN